MVRALHGGTGAADPFVQAHLRDFVFLDPGQLLDGGRNRHSVRLLGEAAIHISEMAIARNDNPGNAGGVFYMDIIGPLLLITLLAYSGSYRSTAQARTQTSQHLSGVEVPVRRSPRIQHPTYRRSITE